MTTTFERAKVGNRVWTPFGPECEVGGTNAKIEEMGEHMWVRLDNGPGRSFYQTGCLGSTDSFPTLFWSRPSIVAPEMPGRTKKVKVEVRPIDTPFSGLSLRTDRKYPHEISDTCWRGPIQTIEIEVYDD